MFSFLFEISCNDSADYASLNAPQISSSEEEQKEEERRVSTCERASGERHGGLGLDGTDARGRVIIKRFIRLLSRSYSALSVRVVSPRFFPPSLPRVALILVPVYAFLSSL